MKLHSRQIPAKTTRFPPNYNNSYPEFLATPIFLKTFNFINAFKSRLAVRSDASVSS